MSASPCSAPSPAARPGGPLPGAGSAALTGKRRIAFASYVDQDRLPGFLRLLRSLALSDPGVCEDYVVLHDGLPESAAERIHALRPRTELRRIDADRCQDYAKSGAMGGSTAEYAVLEIFRIREYGTVIALDTALVARGGLDELLRLRDGLAAAPGGPEGVDGRVLVIQRPYLTDEFCARLEDIARHGDYPRERYGPGVLEAALDGEFVRLGPEGPFADSAFGIGTSVGAGGLGEDEPSDADFHAAFMALPAAHHDLLVHYGTPHVARTGDLGPPAGSPPPG